MNDDESKQRAEILRALLGLPSDYDDRTSPLGMHIVANMEEAFARKRKLDEERKQRIEERKRRAQEQEHKKPSTTNPPTEFSDIDG